MNKHQPTQRGGALIASDIAKQGNEVLIELPGRRGRRRLTASNTRADHDRLLETLGALGHLVIVGFEATGNYHRPLAWRLLEARFELRPISSVAQALTRQAVHNCWDKNDPLAEAINDIQELSKTHEVVSKAKTEILHRIQNHYLPPHFPEVERFHNNTRSDLFFAFLDLFPTPASITALGKDAFITAAWDVVGRKVSKARLLADIYETTRSSIGIPIDPSSPAIAMCRMVIAEARSLIRQNDAIERTAHELLQDRPDYWRLRHITGIGPMDALTILAEAGDLKRSWWSAAQIAIWQHENIFKEQFERYIAKDQH